MLDNRGDIHHLFPKNYLLKYGVTKTMYNQIANYVLLQQEVNIRIADASPCEYMGVVTQQCQTGVPIYGNIVNMDQLYDNLEQNCIPEEFVYMKVEDYSAFLEQRRTLMAQKIRKYYESL